MDEDIGSRIWQSRYHGLAVRHRPLVKELTVHKSMEEVVALLDQLEQRFGSAGREKPLDVLLTDRAITQCHASL